MTANPGSGEGAGPRPAAGGPGPGGPSSPPPPPQGPPLGYGHGYQQPPYPPGYGPPRRLVRRTDNKTLGGVASGIADYFGVDVVLVRVGFIVLACVGGAGIPLYLLLWLLVPAATPADIAAARYRPVDASNLADALDRIGGWKAVLAVALVLIGAGSLAGHFARPGIFWAVALIGLGVYLFRLEAAAPPARPGPGGGHSPGQGPAGGPGPGVAPEPGPHAPADAPTMPHSAAPGAWYGQGQARGAPPPPPVGAAPPPPPGMATATWPLPTAPSAPPPPAAPPATRPGQRSLLGWVTVAAGLVVTGVAVALSNLLGFSLTPAGALGLFLTVLGLGLIVSAFRGRAGWLIVLGVLLVPVLFAASLLDPAGHDHPWRSGFGMRLWQPTSAADVQPQYRLGGGRMILDLRGVTFGPAPRAVAASLGAGQLLVLVGESQAVEVTAQVNAGQTTLLGHVENGLQVTSSVTDPPNAPNPLQLDLRVGAGEVEVRRLAASDPVPEIGGMAPEPAVTTVTTPTSPRR